MEKRGEIKADVIWRGTCDLEDGRWKMEDRSGTCDLEGNVEDRSRRDYGYFDLGGDDRVF